MEFKTIERVPILSTGTYRLSSGEQTFTADDLKAAVLAASDPTVTTPRIKLGHLDERFEADPALDGEPAMGTVKNLTLSDDGQTILGDLANVPAWLADSMPSAYPGRSVEGGFGYTAPSGHRYDFVIENLALLGTTWPGVGSLADLQDVLGQNGSVPTDVSAKAEWNISAAAETRKLDAEDEEEVKKLMGEGKTRAQAIAIVERSTDEANEERDAKRKAPKVAAALDVAAIPRTFAADLRAGKLPKLPEQAWPRSIEASDDGSLSILVDAVGTLMRLPVTIADKTLTYGEPQTVHAANGPLSTDNLHGPRVLASWPSTSAQAPERITMNLDVDQSKLAAALGLAEDADEAAINEKLGITAETPEPGDGGENGETATTPAPEAEPVAASTGKLPDGVVAIDAKRLAELEANAQAGAAVAKREAERSRDAAISAAIEGGRIVASSAETWRKRFETAPEEATKLLTASVEEGGLAAVIPVEAREMGRAGSGDTADVAASAPRALPELNKTEATA